MNRNFKTLFFSLLLLPLLFIFTAPSVFASSFVTCTADSLYNSKNYAAALKHYDKIAGKYYNEAVRPEIVNYLFGYESVKKAVVTKTIKSARTALYSFYMQALCNIHLADHAGAVNCVTRAFLCFSFPKTLIPKSLGGEKTPEIVLISQPVEVINDYSSKIKALPINISDVLNVLRQTARARYASYTALSQTPQGPSYNEQLAKFNALVAAEKAYSELCVNIISADLETQKFHSLEALVSFMKNYGNIDQSAASTLEVSNKIIACMTALLVAYQNSNVQLSAYYATAMQSLISINAYFKGYLATNGGR